MSDAGLVLVANALGGALRALDIRDLPLITDRGVCAVAVACPSVEYMNLWRLQISSYAVCAVAEACGGSLRILILGESGDVDDEALFSIAEQCEVLSDLELTRLAQVTDAGLGTFLAPGAVPWLKRIVVNGCQCLTDDALLQLERKEGLEVSATAVRKVGVAEKAHVDEGAVDDEQNSDNGSTSSAANLWEGDSGRSFDQSPERTKSVLVDGRR